MNNTLDAILETRHSFTSPHQIEKTNESVITTVSPYRLSTQVTKIPFVEDERAKGKCQEQTIKGLS